MVNLARFFKGKLLNKSVIYKSFWHTVFTWFWMHITKVQITLTWYNVIVPSGGWKRQKNEQDFGYFCVLKSFNISFHLTLYSKYNERPIFGSTPAFPFTTLKFRTPTYWCTEDLILQALCLCLLQNFPFIMLVLKSPKHSRQVILHRQNYD